MRLYGVIVYSFLWSLSYFVFRLFCNIKIEGKENIPKRGRLIVASNHQNFFDGTLIANLFSPLKRVYFLVSKRPLKMKIYQYIAKVIGYAVIGSGLDEYNRALKKLNNHLSRGKVVGIFPEGIVTGFNIPTKFKGGVAKLSLDSKTNVLPIYMSGTYELRSLKYWLSRPNITIKIGKPVDLYNYLPVCGNNLDKVSAVLREKVIELFEPKEIEVLEKEDTLVDIGRKSSDKQVLAQLTKT